MDQETHGAAHRLAVEETREGSELRSVIAPDGVKEGGAIGNEGVDVGDVGPEAIGATVFWKVQLMSLP